MTREEAIKKLKEVEGNNLVDTGEELEVYDELLSVALDMAIEALQGWIPCSERLPETDDEVLAADGVDMFVAWYGYDRIWKSTDHNYDPETPILAWMPLPKPYKGGGEE